MKHAVPVEDMAFEVNEAERVFDFINLSFGAFLSAYIGLKLAQGGLDGTQSVRIAALLVEISFVGLSLRGLGIPLIRGGATVKHFVASIVTLAAGAVAYVLTCRELDYSMEVMGVIGLGWLLAPVICLIPLTLRRWIKIYD